jgi:hypothetical protein
MKKIFAVLFVIAFSSQVMAQECLTKDKLIFSLRIQSEELRLTDIDEKETKRFFETFASADKRFAALNGSRVSIASMANGVNVVIVTYDKFGCVHQMLPIPEKFFTRVLTDKGI